MIGWILNILKCSFSECFAPILAIFWQCVLIWWSDPPLARKEWIDWRVADRIGNSCSNPHQVQSEKDVHFQGSLRKKNTFRTMAHPQTWLKSVLTFRSLYSSPIYGLFTLSETLQTFVKCCRTAVVSLLEIYILKVIHCNPLTTGQWDVSVILHGNWYFNFHHEFHCCPARV